jgi:signal transduction histidine kinase
VHVTLYRIAQEALSNVVKHAGSSQAKVSLRCEPTSISPVEGEVTERIELRIKDDGRGFDPEGVPADCLGLRIIRERADAIGASIEIESQTGCGTQLVLVWHSTS